VTVSQLFVELKNQLDRDTAAFDITQLFDRRFGRNARLLRPDMSVSDEVETALRGEIAKLKSGYPLQYILGEWDFYGLTFKVGEGVLIPRADTEISVETALELLKGKAKPRIADFCAGSGAIALAMANQLPDCEIYAVELFDAAFDYLNQNISALDKNNRVKAVKADVLGNISALPGGLDMIVSNPPYITADEMKELSDEVKCEPETALFGGDDGLIFYRSISKSAQTLLNNGGWLVFEGGWKQAQEIKNILKLNGFTDISSAFDAGGIERCIYGRKPV